MQHSNHHQHGGESARKEYNRGKLQLVKAFATIFFVSILTYLPLVILPILIALDVLGSFHSY